MSINSVCYIKTKEVVRSVLDAMSGQILTSRRVSFYALMLAIATWFLFAMLTVRAGQINEKPGVDFIITYTAAKLATTNPDKMYDIEAQQVIHRNLIPVSLQGPEWQHNYPPFFSIVLLPLGNLPYSQAYWLWTGMSIILYGLAIWTLICLLPSTNSHAVSISIIAVPAPAFVWCILTGQTTVLSLFLWTLVFYFLKRSKLFFSGLLLGLLAYRFQYLIVFGPVLLIKRFWKVIIGAVLCSLGLLYMGGLVFSFQLYLDYLSTLRLLSGRIVEALHPLPKYISLYAFFRLLLPHYAAVIFTIVAASALLYWLGKTWKGEIRPREATFDLQFATVITATLLLMHHSLVYDLMLLTIPAIAIYQHRSLFPHYYKGILALLYFAPYYSFIVAEKSGVNPVQPLLLWLAFEIYRALRKNHP